MTSYLFNEVPNNSLLEGLYVCGSSELREAVMPSSFISAASMTGPWNVNGSVTRKLDAIEIYEVL